MPYKDKDKQKEASRRSYHKNLTEEKRLKNNERDKLRMAAKTPEERRIIGRKKAWRQNGLKGDIHKIHDIFMNTNECYYCNKTFTGGDKKSMEHDHLSGYYRCTCCHKCNMYMKRIDTLRLKLMLDIHRYNYRI